MAEAEPAEEANMFFDFLAFIGNPVIEGLTIVAAGYFLFRMERRARRKEVAALVEATLIQIMGILDAGMSDRKDRDKSRSEIEAVSAVLNLRPAYDGFTKIADKIGILGTELINSTNFVLHLLHTEILHLEWKFPSIGPSAVQVDEETDWAALNLEAGLYLVNFFGRFEKIAAEIEKMAPAITVITGTNKAELLVDKKAWGRYKDDLRKRLGLTKDDAFPSEES